MLSRAVLRAGSRQSTALVTRGSASCPAPSGGGQRDEVNFPRPTRQEPGKVRLGFIPDEWFLFFHQKTGVTGPYVFGTGLATYLFSKEIYVMEHEYYAGLSILLMCWYATKKFGPMLGQYLDKEVDEVEKGWNESRDSQIRMLQEAVAAEKKTQWSAQGQELLVEAKKENVLLQLEAAYRERLMKVYTEVKRRLDYQVAKSNADRRISQKHMVDWIVANVRKAITPDQEKETLNRCIADLGALAAHAK